MKGYAVKTNAKVLSDLWQADRAIYKILRYSRSLREARELLLAHLNDLERTYFNIYSTRHFKDLHIIEKNNAKECIRVLKNIIRTENERITKTSALEALHHLARGSIEPKNISKGFLLEFLYLFRGINGMSGFSKETVPFVETDATAPLKRSNLLDSYSNAMDGYFSRYSKGLDPALIARRKALKAKILQTLGGSDEDWKDHRWHLKHLIRDRRTLSSLVKLDRKEVEGLEEAERVGVPFQITPYYLSLFNERGRDESDRAVRAQVLPSAHYAQVIARKKECGEDMDFMGERSTSPVPGITRRYPRVLILKPFDSCPQICVYCQRNWEVKKLEEGTISRREVHKAIRWIKDNPSIKEVLLTGGDPLTLDDQYIDVILWELSKIEHVQRVRIGTRVLVTLPFRFTPELIRTLSRYHRWGKRELCVVTHVEHPTEITPETLNVVKKLRSRGMNIYNQQVFTYYNSRKFETCFLRSCLKVSGIDPYYSFNTKGKEETDDFRVPIARIEQERMEEARLLPGLVRTDEPVFNVPKLGKSHLRAWQDHEPIMVLPTGERVYRFYPWESKLNLVSDYIYTDVPIWDYIEKLHSDGEDIDDYSTIWYYF